MFDVLITGGLVVDGTGRQAFRADVAVTGERIAAVALLGPEVEAKERLDAAGRVVTPGFIDAHVHGDLMLLADPYHEPAIRQGVTTYILGQDGSSVAPASASTLEYMRHYTAGFNGNPDLPYSWKSVAQYLEYFDRRTALNVAYLIPNGNVRMEVMGLTTRTPTPDELRAMRRLVCEGMEEGAVGLSSGLDYIPSRYANTEELIALCEEIAPAGGVYVTHMRRYDPDGLLASMDEVFRIGREARVPVHISHFNCRADLGLPHLDRARGQGLEATFDLYCYLAGSTILGMIALPPWVQEGGMLKTVERLRGLAVRQQLAEWFAAPRVPLETVRLAHIPAESYRRHEGQSLAEAAAEAGQAVGDFVCDLLAACSMVVGCVVPHQRRGEQDIRALMRHDGMMAGSDGIFVGGRPHPRGCGCFARYLGHYVRDTGAWPLEEAVAKATGRTAERFQLSRRGLVREGYFADLAVFDPAALRDRATFEDGKALAEGMEHVLVNGSVVLTSGRRTAALPGRPLRRGQG